VSPPTPRLRNRQPAPAPRPQCRQQTTHRNKKKRRGTLMSAARVNWGPSPLTVSGGVGAVGTQWRHHHSGVGPESPPLQAVEFLQDNTTFGGSARWEIFVPEPSLLSDTGGQPFQHHQKSAPTRFHWFSITNGRCCPRRPIDIQQGAFSVSEQHWPTR